MQALRRLGVRSDMFLPQEGVAFDSLCAHLLAVRRAKAPRAKAPKPKLMSCQALLSMFVNWLPLMMLLSPAHKSEVVEVLRFLWPHVTDPCNVVPKAFGAKLFFDLGIA